MGDLIEFDNAPADSSRPRTPDNPWRTAMDRILAGLILTSFNLQFLYLQYILPAVGVLTLYLGFRALRGGGSAFERCRKLALARLILLAISFAVSASPLNLSAACAFFLGALNCASTLALFYMFRRALQTAYADLGQEPDRDPMRGAIIWYLVMTALALFLPDVGWMETPAGSMSFSVWRTAASAPFCKTD